MGQSKHARLEPFLPVTYLIIASLCSTNNMGQQATHFWQYSSRNSHSYQATFHDSYIPMLPWAVSHVSLLLAALQLVPGAVQQGSMHQGASPLFQR
jgi:hypothetical protein